jgi:serine/threonine protein kinase
MDNSFFIAMEYVSGHNLRTILSLCNELGMQLPVEIAVFLAMKLCSALFYAHTKKDYGNRELHIVHRDISPQNILLSNEGEVKLVDFGIAKASIKASHTVAGSLKGKLLYMSPEQAEGKAIDQRSDIFSLGNVLYECLTGRKLIAGDSELSILKNVREARFERPSAYNPRIPAKLEGIVLKALALSVTDRYGTAKEFEKDLKEFVQQAKYHTNESDVADYIRSLFLKDVHLLQQFEAKKVRTQTKPSVIMPDTGMIQAHEQAVLGQVVAVPRRSSRKHLPLVITLVVLGLGALAAWWFFLRSAKPAPSLGEPPVVSQIPEQLQPQPVEVESSTPVDGAGGTANELPLDELPIEGQVDVPSETNQDGTNQDSSVAEVQEPAAEDPNKDLKERLAKLRQELEQTKTDKSQDGKVEQKRKQ